MTNRYRPMLRPASFATLPSGLQWEYVEAPYDIAHLRPDLPVSRNPHGIIQTVRPLTTDEMERFSLWVAL